MSGGHGPEVWLIRHAESAWNAAGRWQGQGDPGLSERGRSQARALAETVGAARREGPPIEALWTSDLRRARQTAEALAEALELPLQVDRRLRERDLGAWSGLTTPEIAGRWPLELERLRAGDPALRPGGGESLIDVRGRAAEFLAHLAVEIPAGARVLLVTHGGWIRALRPGHRAANAEVLPVALPSLRASFAAGPGMAEAERL